MKLIVKLLSVCLAAAAVITVPLSAAGNPRSDAEFVTESLSNYSLGYMSWGVKKMGLDALQEKLEKSGKTLPEVKVAVIDSGLNTQNKYLKGRYTNDGYNFLNNNTDINDEQFHGTMVSGIIADGTSSNVKVMPIKVNDANGKGSMKNVAKGINYAVEHGADVINLSLSTDDSNHTVTVLDEAIDNAIAHNVVITVAAGNQGGDTADRYPANKDNVITVTSVDKKNKIADGANTGASVDFALPGELVFAPYKSIAFVDSGTSLAAPHAAAAAALLKTWHKELNQAQIMEVLKGYTVDLGAKGFDATYGWGMLDLSSFDLNAAPPAAPVLIGDVNLDGKVNINDATALQNYLAELSDLSPEQQEAADVDGDGKITIRDVTEIQRYVAELITEFGG